VAAQDFAQPLLDNESFMRVVGLEVHIAAQGLTMAVVVAAEILQ
jgi:hypothetical protein